MDAPLLASPSSRRKPTHHVRSRPFRHAGQIQSDFASTVRKCAAPSASAHASAHASSQARVSTSIKSKKGSRRKTLLAYHPRWSSLTHALTTDPRFQPMYGSVQGQRGPFADWQLYSDGALDFDIRRSGEACFTGPCVHVYYLQSPPGAKVEMILAVSRISAEGGKTKQQRWWGILIFLSTRKRGGHGPLRVGSHSSHQCLLVFTALPRPRCAQCEVSQSPASRNPTTLSLALGKRIHGFAPDGTAHATHMAILIDDCWTEGGRERAKE